MTVTAKDRLIFTLSALKGYSVDVQLTSGVLLNGVLADTREIEKHIVSVRVDSISYTSRTEWRRTEESAEKETGKVKESSVGRHRVDSSVQRRHVRLGLGAVSNERHERLH